MRATVVFREVLATAFPPLVHHQHALPSRQVDECELGSFSFAVAKFSKCFWSCFNRPKDSLNNKPLFEVSMKLSLWDRGNFLTCVAHMKL